MKAFHCFHEVAALKKCFYSHRKDESFKTGYREVTIQNKMTFLAYIFLSCEGN